MDLIVSVIIVTELCLSLQSMFSDHSSSWWFWLCKCVVQLLECSSFVEKLPTLCGRCSLLLHCTLSVIWLWNKSVTEIFYHLLRILPCSPCCLCSCVILLSLYNICTELDQLNLVYFLTGLPTKGRMVSQTLAMTLPPSNMEPLLVSSTHQFVPYFFHTFES